MTVGVVIKHMTSKENSKNVFSYFSSFVGYLKFKGWWWLTKVDIQCNHIIDIYKIYSNA